MKIKCSYCGAFFDDTMTECPHCGALNEGVVRTVSKQPLTIEELTKWYKDRGLPPYETTRFFIGENHKGPRAFGIYKDEHSGNFVVYKNKDSGQRAIRYEGTDEAYAVNELYQRLKQEIIEQKKLSVQKHGGKKSSSRSTPAKGPGNKRRNVNAGKKPSLLDRFSNLGCMAAGAILLGVIVGFIALIIGIAALVLTVIDSPVTGYYQYHNQYMYFSDWTDGIPDNGWIVYDEEKDKWDGVQDRKNGPDELKKNKTAQKYFLGVDWNKKMGCPDFLKSKDYLEISGNNSVSTGYYKYNDRVYYHDADDRYSGWYTYDDDDTWSYVTSDDVPEDLAHYYGAQDFYYTPDWDSETQLTDFRDTEIYEERHANDSSSSSWDNDDSDSDYDWDSGYDSWDSDSSDWDSDW